MVGLGNLALVFALGAAVWGGVSALAGARTGRETAVRSGEGAIRAAALCLSVAGAALFYAFLTRDFSVRYVAEFSSQTLSTFYTVSAFWAGHQGSLLLWVWVLSIVSVIVVQQNRARNRQLMPYVVAVLSTTIAYFAALVFFTSNPFDRLPFTPLDGQGLNPLLQNYEQFFHPVTTYFGYLGFTIPFAFCVAALVTGRLDETWVTTVRKWMVFAWLSLSIGILFGARWAYVTLGWGGYWAWDPVENASLLPWLTSTAYLHSVMIQERKGMLKVWNVSLAIASFALAIFGTFLVRSGAVSSVHAFAQSDTGVYLIAAAAAVVLLGGWLIVRRLPELASNGVIESVVSRETSFLLNNLLLVAIAVAVFWGTVFPIVAEAVRGVKVSVGPPFFEVVVTPMGVALLALVGFCPLLAWRKATVKNLRRNFVLPLATGLIAAAALLTLTMGRRLGMVLVLGLCAFVTATITAEFYRGAKARRRVRGGGWTAAVTGLVNRNPRRYGGYLIHFGVVVLLAGVALHVSFKSEHRASLHLGESAQVEGYTLVLEDITTEETAHKSATFAMLQVQDGKGRDRGRIRAERALYANQDQPVSDVGILSTPIEDLYVILESADPAQGVVSLAFLVNPGIFWIWVGAVIFIAGGFVVAWPESRPRTEVTREREAHVAAAP
jgi:cytochrome c-type biogenesis protein CcmF